MSELNLEEKIAENGESYVCVEEIGNQVMDWHADKPMGTVVNHLENIRNVSMVKEIGSPSFELSSEEYGIYTLKLEVSVHKHKRGFLAPWMSYLRLAMLNHVRNVSLEMLLPLPQPTPEIYYRVM